MVLSLLQHVHDAKSLAAQGKRILGAGRDQAAAEGSHQIVNLVSQRNDAAGYRSRLGITGKARHVVLVNGLCHSGILTIQKGILTAHNPL